MKTCNCLSAKFLSAILLFLFAYCLLAQTSQISFYEFFTDSVLRLNILRTGNYHHATFTVHSITTDNFWSGCRSKTIEPFDYGTFKIHVYDSLTNQLVFTRSWSSLFSEYIFTEHGETTLKTFEEVIRIPFPRRTIKIVFFSRKNNIPIWQKDDSIYINPRYVNVTQRPSFPHFVEKIMDAGKPQHTMDIVFVSDGYRETDGEKFFQDVRRVAGYILNSIPYTDYQNVISIWAVFIPSLAEPKENQPLSTTLCSFHTFEIERYIMTEQVFLLHDYVAQVPYDHIVILVNTDQYGGGGIYNFYATCPSDNPFTNFLIIHETGHSIGGLADEYWTSEVSVKNFYHPEYEPWEPNITTLVNFDKKWHSMLSPETPIPTPATAAWKKNIGVFEGAGYQSKGIFRPAYDCTMKSVSYNNFCGVCQESLKRVIRYYTK